MRLPPLAYPLILAATAAGCFWLGFDYRDARAGRERAAELAATSRAMERAMERQVAAQAVADAVDRRLQLALRENRNATRPRVECPPTGDVRDAVLPGLADRLRRIDAAAGEGAAAGVAVVPAASASGR